MSARATDRKPSNASFKSPSAYQLRALVLDYLSHNCYGVTARAFLRESTVEELDVDEAREVLGGASGVRSSDELEDVERDEDPTPRGERSEVLALPPISPSSVAEVRLTQIEQRREIRDYILAGEIDEAIDLLNRYFPSVLSESARSSSSSYTGMKAAQQDASATSTYLSPTSVEPSHLLLNLRVQAFIECCRTEPIKTPSRSDPSSPGSDASRHTSPPPVPSPPSPSANAATFRMDPAKMAILIQKTRKLNELVKALPKPRDREEFKPELTNVASLLAYPKPETSAVAKYMSWERRVALSDQANRAILDRCGLAPVSDIELAVRYTTVLWHYAKINGVKPRAGILMPPRPSAALRSQPTSAKPDKKEGEGEQLPTFDLHHFVQARRP